MSREASMPITQQRPTVIACCTFGGRSPKTGKRVGERHRWDGGAWGKGQCEFCGRCLDQVLTKPQPTTHLTGESPRTESRATLGPGER